MKKIIRTYSKFGLLVLTTSVMTFALSSCGDSSASKPEGKLKDTDYCKNYKAFEAKVATAEPKEQRKALEKIVNSKDFPDSPSSLKEDYEFIIEGFKKFENDTYNINDQDKYKAASERTQRHAIENCEILVSNSGS